jgi:hypothetical protein
MQKTRQRSKDQKKLRTSLFGFSLSNLLFDFYFLSTVAKIYAVATSQQQIAETATSKAANLTQSTSLNQS